MNNDLNNVQQLLGLAKHRAEQEALTLRSFRQQYEHLSAQLDSCEHQEQEFSSNKHHIKRQLIRGLMLARSVKPSEVLDYADKIEKLDLKQQQHIDKITEVVAEVIRMKSKVLEQTGIYTAAEAKVTKIQTLDNELTTALENQINYKEDTETEDTYAGIWSHRRHK